MNGKSASHANLSPQKKYRDRGRNLILMDDNYTDFSAQIQPGKKKFGLSYFESFPADDEYKVKKLLFKIMKGEAY
jgi:hypothetical protein